MKMGSFILMLKSKKKKGNRQGIVTKYYYILIYIHTYIHGYSAYFVNKIRV